MVTPIQSHEQVFLDISTTVPWYKPSSYCATPMTMEPPTSIYPLVKFIQLYFQWPRNILDVPMVNDGNIVICGGYHVGGSIVMGGITVAG